MKDKIVYTADDEEQDCWRCDNFNIDSNYFCTHSCGPEHWWYGYQRTAWEDRKRYGVL